MAFTVATEMPSGARSRGYSRKRNPLTRRYEPLDEEVVMKWFEGVLRQMKEFNISGSAVLLLNGETEMMKENIYHDQSCSGT
jgi:hypothetical protein